MNIKNIHNVIHNISTSPMTPKIPVPLIPVIINANSHSLLKRATMVITKRSHGWLITKENTNKEANPPIHKIIL